MINRDFSRSGKEYINKNKFVLIGIALIVLIGVIMMCVMGFNAGADIKGYNTFTIKMSNYSADKIGEYTDDIKLNLASHDGDLYSTQITGEGDQTAIVVKYMGKVDDVDALNEDLAEALEIKAEDIFGHTKAGASVTSKDYIYTIAGGLIILVLAVLFLSFRYNVACAITAFGGSVLSVALLMSLTAIFRLNITSSFLAINIITMLLVLIESFILFDGLERSREALKDKNDRATQLSNTLKVNGFRQKVMFGAIFAMALILVVLAPSAIKQVALVVLFAVVVAMFVTIFALPFLWNLTITQVSDKIRVKKEKTKKAPIESATDVEGELENNYTENQVIEVKEDSGDDTPSNDDNITIG